MGAAEDLIRPGQAMGCHLGVGGVPDSRAVVPYEIGALKPAPAPYRSPIG